jgi:PKD repeat protein
VSHTFSVAGARLVTLTVTDNVGSSASTAQTVTVTAVASPTVTLASTPSPPLAAQQATLRATATAATGHIITRYSWNFGDGTTAVGTSPTVTHTWQTQGSYVATVTVTDDLGQTASGSLQLDIVSSAVSATIVFSPTDPDPGQQVHFRAVNPVAPNGATISSYEWNFGDSQVSDGGTDTGQSVAHTYTVGGHDYIVRLTITDSNGNVGVVRATVPVGD